MVKPEPTDSSAGRSDSSQSRSTAAAASEAAAATTAAPPRGHVVRDGGGSSLPLPPTATTGIVVTDRTNLAVMPAGSYDVADGKVVRRSGVWARGTGRWLVEYDRAS